MNPLSLFNSTSLLFLGVLVLVCALLFVYFENKAREQNHKISSMLSLVSSLTEEVHSIRRQMNPIGGGCVIKQNAVHYEVDDEDDEVDEDEDDLVSVSDDDEEELDEEELDEDDELDEVEDEDEDEDDDDDDIMDTNVIEIGDNVKILTLLQPIELVSDEEDDSDALDVEELDSSDDEGEEEKLTNDDVKIFDLKSIHLEESATVDYKKLSVGKLKTIVAEKGLASDPAKLKKQELLKLLNAE